MNFIILVSKCLVLTAPKCLQNRQVLKGIPTASMQSPFSNRNSREWRPLPLGPEYSLTALHTRPFIPKSNFD